MKKKSAIPELKVSSVLKHSISVFRTNFLLLFSVALVIDFIFFQLFSNINNWSVNQFEIDISSVTPTLTVFTATIFLIFTFYRLALDVLETNTSSRKRSFSLHGISKLIWPQDNKEWRSLGRMSVVIGINWIFIVIAVAIAILTIDLVSLMHDRFSSIIFWSSIVICGAILFAVLALLSFAGIRIWLAIPIVVSEDMTIREAILHSWKITECCWEDLFRLNTIILVTTIFLFQILVFMLVFLLLLAGMTQAAAETLSRVLSDAIFPGFVTTVTAVCFHRVKQLQPQHRKEPHDFMRN